MKLFSSYIRLNTSNFGMIKVYRIATPKSIKLNWWIQEINITNLFNLPRPMKKYETK